LGYGSGDGVDEAVPFSFHYQQVKTIKSATLTLVLRFENGGAKTDQLSFAQQGDHTVGYGNK
jgi:hypothetical protein